MGDEPTETLLQSGEEEPNQEEDPLEDAEGEDDDDESVGLAFLRFHCTTYAYLWIVSQDIEIIVDPDERNKAMGALQRDFRLAVDVLLSLA